MNDDFEGAEERRLHLLFGRLRRQVFEVSESFTRRVRRRLRQAPSPRYRHVPAERVIGQSLLEILNVLSRLLGGGADVRPPIERDPGEPSPRHDSPTTPYEEGER